MALRMLGYVAALYEELERMEEFRRGKLPTVLAVVLYNGEREWVETLDTRERSALEPGSDVEGMLPRMRFPVIDERRAGQLPAELWNVAGLKFQLWDLSTLEDLAELAGRLRLWLGGVEGAQPAGGVRDGARRRGDPGVLRGGLADAGGVGIE